MHIRPSFLTLKFKSILVEFPVKLKQILTVCRAVDVMIWNYVW